MNIGHIMQKNGNMQLDYTINIDENIIAPIALNQKVGTINVVNQQEVIATYDLVALEAVEKCGFGQLYGKGLRTVIN